MNDAVISGFRIGVTSHRRSEDLIEALERRGATVIHAPAMKIAPVAEDLPLTRDTEAVLAARPDITVITTAYGRRRWTEAADAAGLGEYLVETLDRSRIFVRGPKARGAVRANGLDDAGISADERTSTLVDMLLAEPLRGQTIAFQQHGYADFEQLERLRAAGARVLTVAPYRWFKPEGADDKVPQLIESICAGHLDVVTFTSAPAVDALWSTSREMDLSGRLTAAFQSTVVSAAVGPVTAQPLIDVGVEPIMPERYRMGALIRLVVEHLSEHGVQRCETAFGQVEVRGDTVTVAGTSCYMPPAPMAVFRALVAAGGAVLSRDALSDRLPAGSGAHAVDMAVSRLRTALPEPKLIATVVKRGYRLSV
ncbi:uroporphyrinogen-III synthase [Arthrobacter castelli]|uniref:uroporphyrinogen-III synthase n=1 Tax=Arthrobacter castelli TaxID=271431 RepID=UPI0004217AC4|nr:uroporphyrinogen-III synthase [Arthrobacter castelli]